MAAKIMSGKEVAKQMRAEMTTVVEQLKKEHEVVPGLAVVLVGDNPASISYVTGKKKACKEVGIKSVEHKFDADLPEEDLLKLIDELNGDPGINGILVQLPLPKHIDENKVLNAIDPAKDVDGFHPVNLGKMLIGEKCFLPCTPHGVQQLMLRSGIEVSGKHVVVVGRSNIVGKPLSMLLSSTESYGNATVTLCHSRTKDLAAECREADFLFAAIGRAKLITKDMVKPGAVVVDVGMNRTDEGLVGDCDFHAIKEIAHAMTPVPGGVGPMTIAQLLINTVEAFKRNIEA